MEILCGISCLLCMEELLCTVFVSLAAGFASTCFHVAAKVQQAENARNQT